MVDVLVTVTDKAGNKATRTVTVNVASTPPPIPGGSSILPYCYLHGDQEVIVPDGTYTAGSLTAAANPGIKHPATTGKYKGALVLRAQTPGGVKIVGSGPNRIFELINAERIAFVGIDTEDLIVRPYGCKALWWWYGDAKYPVEKHPQYPGSVPPSGNTTPSGFIAGSNNGKNVDLRFYGMDIGPCGDDGFRVKDTQALWQGVRWEHIAHHGYPPSSKFHNDCIQTMGGSDLTVLDCYMRPVQGEDGANAGCMWIIEASSNSITGRIERLWHHGPGGWGKPLQFHRRDTANPNTTVKVTLKDVHAWNSAPGSPISKSGTGVTVTETNVSTVAPTGDDPATVWRKANPYNTWSTVLFGGN